MCSFPGGHAFVHSGYANFRFACAKHHFLLITWYSFSQINGRTALKQAKDCVYAPNVALPIQTNAYLHIRPKKLYLAAMT